MDRVHRHVCIAGTVLDVDNDQVVDVLHVSTYVRFRQSLLNRRVDHDITGRTVADLVSDVTVQTVLTVGPLDFDLFSCQLELRSVERTRRTLFAFR